MTLFKRKIEQGSQHTCGQFYGDTFHPVEGLANRQLVKHVDGAFTDDGFEVAQILCSGDRADDFALFIMLRAVHGNKHGQGERVLCVANSDGRF